MNYLEDISSQAKQLTFLEAGRRLRKNLFKFSGRASRSEFWLGYAYLYLVFFVFYILDILIIGTFEFLQYFDSPYMPYTLSSEPITYAILIVLGIICIIAMIIILTALLSRRLHDVGKSAWWLLLAFIPLIGSTIIFFWTIFTSVPDNKYGPQPLETK